MWFENSFRRNLVDMHINDAGDGFFLGDFDPGVYLRDLKRAKVRSAMIYLQSHVGYCYFPVSVGHVHSAFASRPDAMRSLFRACRKEGIDTVAYYSLIYNTVEARAHPDWLLYKREEEGADLSKNRYLHCCPNNPDYTAFVKTQISQMLEYAECDGVFFDMPFWPKICVCPCCRAKWDSAHGGEIPSGAEDPAWEDFTAARLEWLNSWIADITALCRSIAPDISVEYNLASAALPGSFTMDGEGVNACSDYAGGDLYNGMAAHSFSCKLYYAMTLHQPFESMTSRCPDLKAHTLSRSRDQLRTSLLTVTAHHGANLVIDAIDPSGTVDGRFCDELGDLYSETGRYEKNMRTGRLSADVGVFLCLAGKGSVPKKASDHYTGALAASDLLRRLHVPYGVVTESSADRLEDYRALILSSPRGLGPKTVERIRGYLEAGGRVWISGDAQKELLEPAVVKTGDTESDRCYIAPVAGEERYWGGFNEKYPLPASRSLPVVVTDGEVLANIAVPDNRGLPFSSIHSDPPGALTDHPALIRKKTGKGELIWSAAPLETYPYERTRRVFAHYLSGLAGRPSLETDAPEQVEVVTFRDENEILTSFVYLSDSETVPALAPFSVSLDCPWEPESANDLTSGEKIPFGYSDGRISFEVKGLKLFRMIRITKRY